LCLLAWPIAVWHEATTLHVVCPSHGELEDAGGADLSHAHGAEHGGHGALWSGAAGPDSGQHEACGFTGLAQSSPAPGGSGPGRTAPAESRPLAQPVPALRAPVFPLFLLAPKQSPPA
jgi:hypothetical protein